MVLKDDAAEYNSLYHLSLQWARTDDVNFTFEEFIRFLNMAINRITAVIIRNDNDWKWADSNGDGELIDATTDITANIAKYPISTPWLKIARVRIKESDGTTWRTLTKKDRRQVSDDDLVSSSVMHYYLLGTNIFLVGLPSYTQANSLEIQFQTGSVYFTPDDEDAEVGFNPTFEELAALMPSLDYLDINGPEEQAVKVRDRIGVEWKPGIIGSGLLGSLSQSYEERHDVAETMSLQSSGRAAGLLT